MVDVVDGVAAMSLDVQERFAILCRDDFTCLYCSARPGNDRLQVDHMLPQCMGGTDVPENLATSCDRCNNGKRDFIAVPKSLRDGFVDRAGWVTWKRWGQWHLQYLQCESLDGGESACAITYDPGGVEYWIGIRRVHEPDWWQHMRRKPWLDAAGKADFLSALSFARLVCDP